MVSILSHIFQSICFKCHIISFYAGYPAAKKPLLTTRSQVITAAETTSVLCYTWLYRGFKDCLLIFTACLSATTVVELDVHWCSVRSKAVCVCVCVCVCASGSNWVELALMGLYGMFGIISVWGLLALWLCWRIAWPSAQCQSCFTLSPGLSLPPFFSGSHSPSFCRDRTRVCFYGSEKGEQVFVFLPPPPCPPSSVCQEVTPLRYSQSATLKAPVTSSASSRLSFVTENTWRRMS